MTIHARVGKGSPSEIRDEVQAILIKDHVAVQSLNNDALKKILTEHNLGIDCSGYAYYVLDAMSQETGNGRLNKHLNLLSKKSPIAKMRAYLRPVGSVNVKVFASDLNSRVIALKDIQPGDIITMMSTGEDERNHILIVTAIHCDGPTLKSFDYTHAIAYPEDGRYGTGVKEGVIMITAPDQSILAQSWTESGTADGAKRILERAQNSTTEVRRLKWLP